MRAEFFGDDVESLRLFDPTTQRSVETLDEIMAHLKKTGFYRDFPPEGSELVSWVVAMSFGFAGAVGLIFGMPAARLNSVSASAW